MTENDFNNDINVIILYIFAFYKPTMMSKSSNPKNVKKGCLILFILVMIVFSIAAITCENEPEKPLTKKEIHEQNIQKLFSGWDGSHIKLTEKIKQSLNDPKSYEHIETTYRDLDSFLIINTTFTAKNAFGGTLKKEVSVVSDTLGNITDVIKWID